MADAKGYFGRSWSLIKKDKGWFKPFLVLSIASWVPVAGALGVMGYIQEWARGVAWGKDEAPASSGVAVGALIKSGWRVFVSSCGWAILLGMICGFLGVTRVPVIYAVLMALAGGVFRVCQLRATIYQDFKAGYQANRIFDMLKRDFGGIAGIVGWTFLFEFVLGLALGIVAIVIFVPALVGLFRFISTYEYEMAYNSYLMEHAIYEFVTSVLGLLPVIAVLGYVAGVFNSMIETTAAGATALWMRQFNIPGWGQSSDPLPEAPVAPVVPVTPVAPATPVAPSGAAPADPQPEPPAPASPAEDPTPSPAPADGGNEPAFSVFAPEPAPVAEEVSDALNVEDMDVPAAEVPSIEVPSADAPVASIVDGGAATPEVTDAAEGVVAVETLAEREELETTTVLDEPEELPSTELEDADIEDSPEL